MAGVRHTHAAGHKVQQCHRKRSGVGHQEFECVVLAKTVRAYAAAVQRRICLRLMSHTTQVSRIDLGAGTGTAEKGKSISTNAFHQKLDLVRVEMELRLRRLVWAKKMTKRTVRGDTLNLAW